MSRSEYDSLDRRWGVSHATFVGRRNAQYEFRQASGGVEEDWILTLD